MKASVIEQYKDRIVIDRSEKVAYLLKELRKEEGYLVLVSYLKQNGFKVKTAEVEELEKLREENGEEEEVSSEDTLSDSEVLEELGGIITESVMNKASDIHIVSDERKGEVKVRVNGMLTKSRMYSKSFAEAMMRAFYQNLKVAESNYVDTQYQSAQFKREDIKGISLPKQVLSIRVQRGPKLNGQFMVLRLLYRDTEEKEVRVKDNDRLAAGKQMLTDYGYLSGQAREIVKVARQGAGIGIIAGPTGSGKSTALKVILEFQHVMYPFKSVYTIEDPPEYPIRGAVQLPVMGEGKEDRFAEALRVCMRSDPDIIMVGEVRDPATAKLSVDASLTGHQVWTTLHAVNSFAVFPRLEGLGISIGKLLETGVLKLIVAQRLVPKLCSCKVPLLEGKADSDIRAKLKDVADLVYVKGSCEKCKGTGISGRVVIAEVLPITPEILKLIKEHGSGYAYNLWRKENVDIVKHGLIHVLNGEVDPHDLIAVAGDFTEEDIEWAMQRRYEYSTSS